MFGDTALKFHVSWHLQSYPCQESKWWRQSKIIKVGNDTKQSRVVSYTLLKPTVRPWKSMVGGWIVVLGWSIFRGELLVSGRNETGDQIPKNTPGGVTPGKLSARQRTFIATCDLCLFFQAVFHPSQMFHKLPEIAGDTSPDNTLPAGNTPISFILEFGALVWV